MAATEAIILCAYRRESAASDNENGRDHVSNRKLFLQNAGREDDIEDDREASQGRDRRRLNKGERHDVAEVSRKKGNEPQPPQRQTAGRLSFGRRLQVVLVEGVLLESDAEVDADLSERRKEDAEDKLPDLRHRCDLRNTNTT